MTFVKVFLAYVLCVLALPASGLALFTWRPSLSIPPLVIGVREGETPQAAAARYLEAIQKDPRLAPLLAQDPLPPIELKDFKKMTDTDFTRRVLLIANRPEDYRTQNNWRIDSFQKPLLMNGVTPYMVPFTADAGLSAAESADLVAQLDEHFSSFLAMGGADIDLTLFGGTNEKSINVNGRRDEFEFALLTKKIATIAQGGHRWMPREFAGRKRIDRLVGVCRGAQFIAKLKGHELDPHIPGHGSHSEKAGEGAEEEAQVATEPLHPLRVHPTTNRLTMSVTDAHDGEIVVDTYHHQRFIILPGSDLELAADNPEDGVAEAAESTDGNIWLLQFHAELMAVRSRGEVQRLGLNFMKAIAKMLTPLDCEAALH
jgi:gamma-glutamyl-gamma-aminobutyrate hydrolase PuuD